MSMPVVTTDKGAKLRDGLLISQYGDSPILSAYIGAYTSEMDWLFENIEAVYLGRMLEYAVGANLDVIGIILDEPRTVELPTQYFGFKDESSSPESGVDGFADESAATDGGIFKDESQGEGTSLPLGDSEYRRLLLAKALVSNRTESGIDGCYKIISTLLGRTPSGMKLLTSDTLVDGNLVSGRNIELQLLRSDTTIADDALVTYFGRYLAPMGSEFTVTRI